MRLMVTMAMVVMPMIAVAMCVMAVAVRMAVLDALLPARNDA